MKASRRGRSSESLKKLYNWFHWFYGIVERNLEPMLHRALGVLDPQGNRYAQDTVLEWACGSGSLGYRLLPRVGRYEGRDQSVGMLNRARNRWARHNGAERCRYDLAPFVEGDMVCGPEMGVQWDWVFMSFALHLFDAETQRKILARSLSQARRGVVVIDHEQRWRPLLALVERLEGSHYPEYLELDFEATARFLGVSATVHRIPGATVVEFLK